MIGLERRILGSGAKSPFSASLSTPVATPRSHGGDSTTTDRRATSPCHATASSEYIDHDNGDEGQQRKEGEDGANDNSPAALKKLTDVHSSNGLSINHETYDERGTVKSPPPFIRSRFTLWVALARMLLVLDLVPPELLAYLQSPSLACIVADPAFTWRHVREARAIRNLFRPPTFRRAYQLRGAVHLPPLLLAALDAIANRLEVFPIYVQKTIVGLILLVIDLAISLLFESLAIKLLIRYSSASREESLERDMPEAIQPPLKHLFYWTSKPAGTDSQVDVDSNYNSPTMENDQSLAAKPRQQQHPLLPLEEIPRTIACAYFGCPVSIVAAHVHESFRNLPLLLMLSAVHTAVTAAEDEKSQGSNLRRRSPLVMPAFLMSLAAYMDVHMVIFAIPLSLFVSIADSTRQNRRAMMTTFFLYFACLHVLSFLLVGGEQYQKVVATSHLQSFQITQQTPSLSVLWYFGMEVFLRFQRFFAILLGGIPYILIGPLTIRLWKYPEVLVAIFWMLGVLFRPPSTLYQLTVGVCLAGLCPNSCIRMRTAVTLVSMCALPIPATLFVVTHWLWLVPGSGEANFLYFQALAYSAFVGLLTVEFTGASLRRDKALRLTEKESRSRRVACVSDDSDAKLS